MNVNVSGTSAACIDSPGATCNIQPTYGGSYYNSTIASGSAFVPPRHSFQGYDPWYMHSAGPYSYTPNQPLEHENRFVLTFIKGNISLCFGCKNHYQKNPQQPYDLCVKHQEWRDYVPAGKETTESRFSNVYYHCQSRCIWLRHPYFIPTSLDYSDIIDQLTSVHKEYLQSQFGLYIE